MPQSYDLIDSGELSKLERFGAKVIARPSSLAIWKKRRPQREWVAADATYLPGSGWKVRGKKFEEWEFETGTIKIMLRLQDNGQVGVFPEHGAYLGELSAAVQKLESLKSSPPRVLNLFAYTGLATLICSDAGASVTHVDLSKRALEWTAKNLKLNRVESSKARLIRDDCLQFLKREARRGNTYDVVIADPPSFSRVSAKRSWKIEQVLCELVEGVFEAADKAAAAVFFTSHHYDLGYHPLYNLVDDLLSSGFAACPYKLEKSDLGLKEAGSSRILPAGYLVRCAWGT